MATPTVKRDTLNDFASFINSAITALESLTWSAVDNKKIDDIRCYVETAVHLQNLKTRVIHQFDKGASQ